LNFKIKILVTSSVLNRINSTIFLNKLVSNYYLGKNPKFLLDHDPIYYL
jgi:hypothetical protein